MRRGIAAIALAWVLGACSQAVPEEPTPPATETVHEGAPGEEGHGPHHPAPVNWTDFGCGAHANAPGAEPLPSPLLATVINVSLLFLLLYTAVRRIANPYFADRRAAIESEIGEAQRLRSEAEAMHREYKERLANMEMEFAKLRDEFVAAGKAEQARILDDAKARAERLRKEGEFAVQQELKQLRDDLLRQAAEAAIASAESTIQKSITPHDHGRLADEYLARLAKTPGAPS